MEVSKKQSRQSGIELLRIIAMLMIVAHHFSIHGIFSNWSYNSSFLEVINSFWSGLLCSFGKVGVDIFIIITGYFNISKSFRFSKALNIFLQTIFYAFLIFMAFFIAGNKINFIGSSSYWFIKYYLILYLLTPILNKVIIAFPKKVSDIVFILTLIIGFIMPLFFKHVDFGVLGTFVALYFVGAYYKLRPIYLDKKYCVILFTSAFVFLVGSLVLQIGYGEFSVNVMKYMSLYSIFTLIFALTLFDYFVKLKIGDNALINKIAKSVFGVYLIHDNSNIRPLLWNKVLAVTTFMDKPYFILYSCIVIITVFLICVILDKILMKLFNSLMNVIWKYMPKLH